MTTTAQDPRTQASAQASAQIAQNLDEYGAGLPANRRAEFRAIASELDKAAASATSARRAHDDALHNLDLHPDGRRARASQAREAGAKAVQDHYQSARTQADILHAALTDDALAPPPGQAEAALARQDAALILSLAEDKAKALRDLATDPDTGVATLAAGPWGRRYLAASGVAPERLDNTMEVTRHAALQAIAERTDSTRAMAARSALGIGALRSAIGAHQTLTTQDLPRQGQSSPRG